MKEMNQPQHQSCFTPISVTKLTPMEQRQEGTISTEDLSGEKHHGSLKVWYVITESQQKIMVIKRGFIETHIMSAGKHHAYSSNWCLWRTQCYHMRHPQCNYSRANAGNQDQGRKGMMKITGVLLVNILVKVTLNCMDPMWEDKESTLCKGT